MAYAPAYPHGSIEEIGNDIFMVRGSIKMNPVMRITRNMAIVRNGQSLSLIDPIRLNDEGERALNALGKVENVIRLGAFHGIDDPYYCDNYKARMWSQPGGVTYTEPPIDVELSASTELPFPNAKLVIYPQTKEPECALVIADGDGLLITCDAVQNYGDYSYNNLPARMLMPLIGFPKTTLVGPIWLKVMTPEGGSLEGDVRQLLDEKFDRFLSAHGTYIESGAYDAVKNAIDKAFAGR